MTSGVQQLRLVVQTYKTEVHDQYINPPHSTIDQQYINYFFPFLLLLEPFCGVFVGVDDAGAGSWMGVQMWTRTACLAAASGALLGGDGLCKKLMKKVARPPLIIYMSHLGHTNKSAVDCGQYLCQVSKMYSLSSGRQHW